MNNYVLAQHIKQQAKTDFVHGVHKPKLDNVFSYNEGNNIQPMTNRVHSNNIFGNDVFSRRKKDNVTDKITSVKYNSNNNIITALPSLNKVNNGSYVGSDGNTFNPITGTYGSKRKENFVESKNKLFKLEEQNNLLKQMNDLNINSNNIIFTNNTGNISNQNNNNSNKSITPPITPIEENRGRKPISTDFTHDTNRNLSKNHVEHGKDEIVIENNVTNLRKTPLNKKLFSNNCSSFKEFCIKEEPNSRFRDYMEDFSKVIDKFSGNSKIGLYILCDGHGGKDTSYFVVDKLPEIIENEIRLLGVLNDSNKIVDCLYRAFEICDKIIGSYYWGFNSGSTCCVVLSIRFNDKITIISANVGDSRTLLVNPNKNIKERLSVDHKASDMSEIQRIKNLGGFCFNGRLMGQLAVSRAFGDFNLKNQGLTAIPYIKVYDLDISNLENSYIVIASDGVWDVLSDDDVYSISKRYGNSALELSESILNVSLQNGTTDNTSVISIKLN